jgi:hypothetical protein
MKVFISEEGSEVTLTYPSPRPEDAREVKRVIIEHSDGFKTEITPGIPEIGLSISQSAYTGELLP